MSKGLTIYQNKKTSWNWLSIQFIKGSPKIIYWHLSFNRPYKQWFAYCSIFPLFFTKNNSEWTFGISLILFRIQLKYQFK